MKRISTLIALLFLSAFAHAAETGYGQLAASCVAVSTTGACVTFNVHPPDYIHIPQANSFTWQTIFAGGTPTSITVVLQGSIDGTTFSTIDTSTSTAGETRSKTGTAYNYFRCNVTAYSPNGTTLGCQITPAFVGSGSGSGPANSSDVIAFWTGTCSASTYLRGDGACSTPSGSGTVTSFSAGDLSPLFTTSEATATSTPALTFSLSTAAAHSFFGNNTGSTAAPGFQAIAEGDVASLVTDLGLKADALNAALTGTPTAPTAAGGTNTTQLATTAFVLANASSLSGLTLGFLPKAASSSTIANSLLDDGITTASTLTYAGSGGITAPSFNGTGSVAATVNWGQGTKPSSATTAITEYAPTSVTSYFLAKPGAAATGIMHWTNSAGTVTSSISGIAIADLTATGTPSSSTFLRGDNTWAAGGALSGLTTGFITKASSSTAVANSLLDDGITNANGLTYTGSAGIFAPSFTGTSAGAAGFIKWTQGTAPSAGTTAITEYAPASVTSYFLIKPGAAASGLMHWANSSGTVTSSISGVAIADLTATGTPSSSTFLRGDNTWATPGGSGTVTSVTGTANQIAVATGTSTPVLTLPSTIIPPGSVEPTGPTPYYDVIANGLVGNGSTDNSTALQAIVNGCSATLGCKIFFPCGVYKFNTGITTSTAQGINWEAATMAGWGNSTVRCVRLTTASAITILTIGDTGADIQNGGSISNIAFEDTSGSGTAVGGLLVNRASRIPIRSCEFDSFTGSGHYGIKFDGGGGGGFDNHNSVWDVRMRAVQNGIIVAGGSDGPDIFGGDIATDSSATAPIGIDEQQTASSSVKIFGTSVDVLGLSTPVGVKIAGDSNFISGLKIEGATPLATCTSATCIGVQVLSTGANNQINIANATKLNTVVQLDSGSNQNYVSGVGVNNDNDVTDSGDINDVFWNGSNDHFLQVHTTTTSLASPWKIEGVTQPGSGSVKLTRMLVPSGRGLIFQQTTGNSGGGYLNADSAIRGCIGFGLYGSCSTSGVTASGTSATLVVGGNTAGQFDFYTDTSLTAGNTFTPTLRASLNSAGLTLPGTINKVTITAPASSATLTIANGKTLTASNTLTFTGTDSSSVAFGAGGTVLYSGGALGTPTSGVMTNVTGLTEAGQTLADNTTNNASTSAHGYLKKLDNTATHYMDGTGAWSTPGGGLPTITQWLSYPSGSTALSKPAANATMVWGMYVAGSITPTAMCYHVTTADNTANIYDMGFFDASGTLLAHTGAVAGTTLFSGTGGKCANFTGSPSAITGKVYFAMTGNASVAIIGGVSGSPAFTFASAAAPATGSTTSGGLLVTGITFSADSYVMNGQMPSIGLH